MTLNFKLEISVHSIIAFASLCRVSFLSIFVRTEMHLQTL